MGKFPIDSYLICATPRTGSTLLCAMLESTGVAGQPESYFRKQDEAEWALGWGLERSSEGHFLFADYLRSAITAGRSKNGVFAARIMWETLEEVANNLVKLYPSAAGNDLDLLNRAFGHTRFIYLQRTDVIAQAVSLLRAVQTDVWHVTDDSKAAHSRTEPEYDFDLINGYVRELKAHNRAWKSWFGKTGIEPHSIRYEDLEKDPVGVTSQVLNFLGLEPLKAHHSEASNRRLADSLNREWMERYRSDIRGRGE